MMLNNPTAQRIVGATHAFVKDSGYEFKPDCIELSPEDTRDPLAIEKAIQLAEYIDDSQMSDKNRNAVRDLFSILLEVDLHTVLEEFDQNDLGQITTEHLDALEQKQLPPGMVVVPVSNTLTKHTLELGVPLVLFQTTDSQELYPEADQNIPFDGRQAMHFSEVRPARPHEVFEYLEERYGAPEANPLIELLKQAAGPADANGFRMIKLPLGENSEEDSSQAPEAETEEVPKFVKFLEGIVGAIGEAVEEAEAEAKANSSEEASTSIDDASKS